MYTLLSQCTCDGDTKKTHVSTIVLPCPFIPVIYPIIYPLIHPMTSSIPSPMIHSIPPPSYLTHFPIHFPSLPHLHSLRFAKIGPVDCGECENFLAERWCVREIQSLAMNLVHTNTPLHPIPPSPHCTTIPLRYYTTNPSHH